jgi:Tol biopolymer transport system component
MPGIFISYRRSDNPDATGRIYDRLVAEFGKAKVFKDVDSIPLGRDFRSYLNEIVGDCAAVLAIVGPRWADACNQAGQRRLEDPDDFVRIELEAALARNIPVVPVLVGNALMPGSAQLPASLTALAFRQSIEVRPDPDFHNDSTRLVAALRKILDPNAPDPVADSGVVRAPASDPQRGRWAWGVAAFAVAGMIGFAIPAIRYLRQTPQTALPETRLDIVTPATDDPASFALSPDGQQIVFVASGDGASRLWRRSLSSTTAQPLSGTEGAFRPFWSPDGRSIGFFARSSLKRLDLGGGAPRTLASVVIGRGGTWNADGTILFAPNVRGPLMRVPATGGAVTAVTTLGTQSESHRQPVFLPDGRRFMFHVSDAADKSGIYLGALDGSASVRLTSADSLGGYLPSGWLLWVRSGTLVAQRLDLEQATLTGETVTVADGVTSVLNFDQWPAVSVGAGLVAYRTGGGGRQQLTWFDRSGKALGTAGDPDGDILTLPRVSPDGRVAVVRALQGNVDLWLLDGARMSRLTFSPDLDIFPVWSPDGTQIAFRSHRAGPGNLYRKLASGAAVEERLVASNQMQSPTSWSADGRFLMYTSFDPATKFDLWVVPMTGDGTPAIFLKTPFDERSGVFSPDGRWVAYQSDESGQLEIYVRPFVLPGSNGAAADVDVGQWQVSIAGGSYPVWRADGKELYFLSPAGGMMAVPIAVSGATFEPGTPVRLFPTRIQGGGADPVGRQYDVARDGRFLINTVLDTAAAPITLIQNWNPEAKK